MRYLCVDSSSGSSICLADCDGKELKVIAEVFSEDSRRHGENLASMVQDIVTQAGCESIFDLNIDYIVCGTGPAPYTGLRCGLVTARVLAKVLSKDLLGVCSLDSLALETFMLLKEKNIISTEIFVATDARRKEIYYATYKFDINNNVIPVISASVDKAENIKHLAETRICAGQGYINYKETLGESELYESLPRMVDSKYMAWIAYARQKQGIDMTDTQPLYLRRPDVQN